MSINYHRVLHSANGKIIGTYPQLSNPIYPGTHDSADALGMLAFEKTKPTTEIPKGVLSKKAKWTDLLSVSFLSGQLFISNKLKNIFREYSTNGVEFIPASVIENENENSNFAIVNPYLSDYSFLDTANCEFVYTDAFGKIEYKKVKFESTDEFLKAFLQNQKDAIEIGYPNHHPLMIKKITFKKECSLDFFAVAPLPNGYVGYFVSTSLRDQIENAGCTGIEFGEPNESGF